MSPGILMNKQCVLAATVAECTGDIACVASQSATGGHQWQGNPLVVRSSASWWLQLEAGRLDRVY